MRIRTPKIAPKFLAFMTSITPMKNIGGMSIHPWIILKPNYSKIVLNHESIHWYQAVGIGILPFYIIYFVWYVLAFLWFKEHSKAYRSIPFEREAYDNQDNLDYLLDSNNPYRWVSYIFKRTK